MGNALVSPHSVWVAATQWLFLWRCSHDRSCVGRAAWGVRALAVVLGAVLVALAAQVSIPLPGTPVPMTLQPMAVLLVGGLLGARLGALSMILLLAVGAAGLPVFTPTVPLLGVARLLGPTGGYLLAYPVAAWATGWFAN